MPAGTATPPRAPDWRDAALVISGIELRRALRRTRLFAFNVAVPLALVAPVALGGAPRQHAAVVFTVLFVFFGMFGSAIPALRDAERGILRRLSLTPLSPGMTLLIRGLAGAVLDFVQLLPALLVASLALIPANRIPGLGLALLGALALANLSGLWIAAIARSVAEGALFAAIVALLLLHASGVFRTPTPGSAASRLEALAPFRILHESMLPGSGAGVVALVVAIGIVAFLTLAAGGILLRALAAADGRQT